MPIRKSNYIKAHRAIFSFYLFNKSFYARLNIAMVLFYYVN